MHPVSASQVLHGPVQRKEVHRHAHGVCGRLLRMFQHRLQRTPDGPAGLAALQAGNGLHALPGCGTTLHHEGQRHLTARPQGLRTRAQRVGHWLALPREVGRYTRGQDVGRHGRSGRAHKELGVLQAREDRRVRPGKVGGLRRHHACPGACAQ